MRAPDFFKKVRQGHRTFLKKLTKVTGLFKNCPATLSNFSKKAHQRYRTFRKKRGPKTHLPTPDLPSDFTGLSKKSPAMLSHFLKKVQQSYRTFQKLSGKVIELFEKNLPRLSNFSKIVRQSSRSF
jgi:hypothetical protein